MIENLVDQLNKTSHSNIKSLAAHAKNSIADLNMELERINAHSKEEILSLADMDEKKARKTRDMIYDIVELYDLWFSKGDPRDRDNAQEAKK